jgi:hypothetical protein
MNINTPKNTEKNGRHLNGRFANGNNGKPKGAVNKNTKDIKEFIVNFLNEKTFEIPLIWQSLDDKEKINLFVHLSKLVLPRTPENEFDEINELKDNDIKITFFNSDDTLLPLNERIAKLKLTKEEIYNYLEEINTRLDKEC